MPNRLAREHSPYLLQHKDNPVDWHPWDDEAFAVARREDKPIFLSVGYSTCHWCHVMEHESFEDPGLAEVLNRHFVSIKVDREERPDVDRLYMTFVQSTTGHGGWPMSVWLTPALEPFYGGTYFPPTSRWGRPGFIDILQEIARVWRDEREKVTASAAAIVERLRGGQRRAASSARPWSDRGDGPSASPETNRTEGPSGPSVEVLRRAAEQFAGAFDARRGGFGDAPKFPRPSELLFLLREHARTGEAALRDMVLVTVRAMALGGIRDHIGGGFHRYSVDGDWRVPHFEKMLYDQAQLVLACAEAAQVSGDPLYLDVALDALEYVQRDLTHPDGGFYSAEDADSVPAEDAHEPHPHKTEGAFYLWRDDEIGDALGADAGIFRTRYGVLPDGNAPSDPHGEFTGRNLLYAARGIDEIAAATHLTAADIRQALDRARLTLLTRRSSRPRPQLDDKVLTAWNGLMIAACARVSRLLPPDDRGRTLTRRHLTSARRAATFIRDHLWNESTGALLRRFRQGEAGVEAYAEDHAYLIFGLLELFQADGDPAWLEWALTLQRRQDELFWDPLDGGWFSTTGRDPSVLLRLKDEYDGAEPAASSVSVMNLLALSHLLGDDLGTTAAGRTAGGVAARRLDADGASVKVERTLRYFGTRASEFGRAMPMLLAALSAYHAGVSQLVLVGDADEAGTRALRQVAAAEYLPTTLTVPVTSHHREALVRRLPWLDAMVMREGRATAYVCRAFACQAPTTSPDELSEQLKALR